MNDKSVAHRRGMNHFGQAAYPDGLVPWDPAMPPDLTRTDSRQTVGRLRSCAYCGSMHPADLAAALKAGAKTHWADFKYGWPHKLYVENVPNPHAGLLESRLGASHAVPLCPKSGAPCEHGQQSFSRPVCECMRERPQDVVSGDHCNVAVVRVQSGFRREDGQPDYTWRDTGTPAQALTYGKFYTVHLQDATPEDRDVIERAMNLRFTFEDGGGVRWQSVGVADAAAAAAKAGA